MYVTTNPEDPDAFAWLVDELLDLPVPAGMEWMSAEQLEGYYLLYRSTIGGGSSIVDTSDDR